MWQLSWKCLIKRENNSFSSHDLFTWGRGVGGKGRGKELFKYWIMLLISKYSKPYKNKN